MKKILLGFVVILFLTSCVTLGFGDFEGTSQTSAKTLKCKKASTEGITFLYEDSNASSVSVAGEFNEWNTETDPMKKNTEGIWELTLKLDPGKYMYKFVINGTDWRADPSNTDEADDGLGGKNSLLIVGSQPKTEKIEPTKKVNKDNKDTFPITFTYKPLTGGKKNVYLAGDFNNWSDSTTPMEEDSGIYEVTLNLIKGKYAYKFVIDGNWITDDNADDFIGDGYGGQNSIRYVGKKEDLNALRRVEFVYKPENAVKEVYLAGSLNDWNQKANKMQADEDGVYKTTLLLKPEEYHYKFVVNGTDWVTDENAASFVEDGFGGNNSVIIVDEGYPKVTIAKGDGMFLTYGIPTEQSIETINPISHTSIEFKAKTHPDDVEAVSLQKSGKKIPMEFSSQSETYDHFRLLIELNDPAEEFDYCYIYQDGDTFYYLLQDGFTKVYDEDKLFHYSQDIIEPFFTPEWVKNGIIYQIFPERFFNGDKANDPDFKEWYYEGVNIAPKAGKKLPKYKQYFHLVEDWYDVDGLKKSPYHNADHPDYNSFYGGDIVGVHQKLDYLKDLGITIIYFNPVFQAKSNHKYDAVDYMKLDPHFGTEAEFKSFVDDAHANGIKVIIDVAYNHTGETFFAFQEGMKNGSESEYYDWFEWKKWPLPDPIPAGYKPIDYYECWWGFGEMPNLNFDLSLSNPEENSLTNIEDADPNWKVVNYLLDDVTEYWMQDMGLDGFRLDVPNEVPFWFWKLFRQKVKSIKPDAYIVAELWSDASNSVNNDYYDAVMNYAFFKDPVMRFFCERRSNAKAFDRDLKQGRYNYPVQATQVMMNLIDSHDTFRYLESAGGDVNRLKLAVLFQMTYVGTPHIWYGDEIGMMGAHDPDCRRPFNWKYTADNEKVALRDYYKKLIQFRKSHPALTTGDFKTLKADGLIYSYLRSNKNESIIVVINNDEKKRMIEIETGVGKRSVTDFLSGKQYHLQDGNILKIELDAMSGAILK